MSGLTLTLFGSPSLARDGVFLQLHSRKCMALLAYLALTGSSHSREGLAALFWPEMDEGRARAALRSTLSRLRNALDGAWLAADWESVRLDPDQQPTVDVVRFRRLLAQCGMHGHPVADACARCLPLLAEAADLYRSDFLAGFTLRDSPQFDDWQSLETQSLQREMIGALERLAEGYAAQGAVERAIGYAQRWSALDPLDEAAHRCLMRLYAGSGQQAAALRQYEAAEQVLSEELGVSPGVQTVELYEVIKSGKISQLQATPPVPHNLPLQPTPFVGREEELAQIAQLLAEPSCRLLSVVGPGGIGKTRLAIQAAQRQAHRFAHGAWFVPLVSLGPSELLAFTILEALDIPLSRSLQPREQLLNVLRERRLLLILDNFEHLLEGSALLAEMVRTAPGLKLLVTSRERLGLRDEWLFLLGGMRFPDEERIEEAREAESAAVWPGSAPEASVVMLGEYSALELFVQCARRVRPDFTLATGGASSVARICRVVEGMPLAIELAAPWVRAMPCPEIAREIEGGLDVLATTLRDVPQRHRSMRAVFDHSWGLLPAEERDVLGKLSVFRGGFRREAAEVVAEASLGALSSLLDRSWLRVTPSGRYEMHELVRQYCGDRLDSEPSVEGQRASVRVRDGHSRYYAAFLQEREPRLFGRRQIEAFREILQEMGNVWAAWNWALECGDVVSIGKCVAPLEEVAELRGWHDDVNQAFDRAADILREQLDAAAGTQGRAMLEETRTVLAEILRSQSLECYKVGLPQRAVQLCEESLELLGHAGHGQRQQKALARATGFLGTLLCMQGDYSGGGGLLRQALALYEEVRFSRGRVAARMMVSTVPHQLGRHREAEELLNEAVALAAEVGDLRYHAWCLINLASVLCDRGKYDRARRAVEQSFRIREELGDRAGIATSHLTMGKVFAGLKRYESARRHYQRGLIISTHLGDPNHRCRALIGLGGTTAALGQYLDARQRFEEAFATASRIGSKPMMVNALIGLGHATCALGEYERSRQCFYEAAELATEAQMILETLDALVGVAHLSTNDGAPERAAELLAFALHHPATRQVTRDRAQDLLTELGSEMSPEVLAAAIEQGQTRELEEVAAEVLSGRSG